MAICTIHPPIKIGDTFGKWTVLAEAPQRNRARYWLCQCACGTQKEVYEKNLRNEVTRSCGCWRKELLQLALTKPVAFGAPFGRLIVIAKAAPRGSRQKPAYLCQCICGNTTEVIGEVLRSGATQSCGCKFKEMLRNRNTKHGLTVRGEQLPAGYSSWLGMKGRTTNPNNPKFSRYGGRGITICARWRDSFSNFMYDMGPKPGPTYSIERRNNDGPYSPKNCYWATLEEQANNRSNNHLIMYRKRTQTLAQWSREISIPYSILHARIRDYGWTITRAFTTPIQSHNLPNKNNKTRIKSIKPNPPTG